MRIIKFRLWDKENKEMKVPLSPVWFEENYYGDDDFAKCADYEDCVLMQFTGLYDKNGKEIYRGDVVKYWVGDKPRQIGKITWGGWQYSFTRVVEGKESTDFFGYNSEDINPNNLEVIGNIYENPELLNVK